MDVKSVGVRVFPYTANAISLSERRDPNGICFFCRRDPKAI